MKSFLQVLMVETVRVMFIIYCKAPCLAVVHKHWFDHGFAKCQRDMFSYSVFSDHDLFMSSLNVDSLFTNIPLEKTVEICTNELFKESSDLVKFLVCYSVGTFHTYHPPQLLSFI